jgi:aryl-alcohol dehydrogenase-like predicted oxidoreductase
MRTRTYLFLRLAAASLLSTALLTASAQTVHRDQRGHFREVPQPVAHTDSLTAWTYTDAQGNVSPVYQGKRGGLYVWKLSAKGVLYRKYLRVQGSDNEGPSFTEQP